MGESLIKQQKLNEAIWLYQQSTATDPCADFQMGLGDIYSSQGNWDEAIQCYQTALALEPDCPEIHASLGEILEQRGEFDEAILAYQQALELKPDWVMIHYLLGRTFADAGKHEDASLSYQQALEIQPDFALAKFGLCMNQLPLIYSSAEEVEYKRQQYQISLESLIQYYQSVNDDERAASVEMIGTSQPFYLAYQGKNDKQLQQKYGQLISQMMASQYPQWSQPIDCIGLKAGEKIRVGFVSRFFYDHSNWKIPIRGWVENINKSEFELFGYYTGPITDSETSIAAQVFDKFCHGDFDLTEWAEKIQQDKLHILIFPEFGMDPTTVRLGCLRLAPVQATSWGHPITSGLPTIDYYLSSEGMEPANAQEHYAEKLLKLPNLSIYYTPLKIESAYSKKPNIGIASNSVMYWCCQSLYKYLPQYDDIFPRIAQALPSAKFVFIKHNSEHVTQVFVQRLAQAFREFNLDYRDFCIFLAQMSAAEFSDVASMADVFLDSIGWSGCNSTLESLAHNIPPVTLPGELMRSRHTMAILDMLGIRELIATSKDDYVNIAVRLGNKPNIRHKISSQIAKNKHRLYHDLTPVRALEDFFRQVIGKSQDDSSTLIISEALRQASELHRHHQISEAEQVYRQVLEQFPHQADALLELGLLRQKQQQPLEAERLLRQATEHLPHSVKAWFALGNIYTEQADYSKAEAAYRQALVLRPDAVSIYNNLGFALQNQGHWEEAIAFYRQALVIQPSCKEAEANLGNALHASGSLHATQTAYYANLNYQLGKKYQTQGHAPATLSYLRHAMTLLPNFAEAELALGVCLRDLGNQPDVALEHFLKVLADQPKALPQVYVELGRTYQMQGNIREAVNVFRDYLKLINPHYAQHAKLAQQANTAQPVNAAQPVNTTSETCPAKDLAQYAPPAVTFGEITVGDYTFPAIPPVDFASTNLSSTHSSRVDQDGHRPFWTVVIPAVNRPEYFPECLASVLAQWSREADMEILVFDNGSNPPLFDIVEALGKGIIRYVRLPQTIPLQENWNTMVALARGEWIFLLQHDDYVLPGFFEQLRDGLEDCPDSVGAAFTNYENIDEQHNVIFSQDYGLGQHRGIVEEWIRQIGVSNPTSPPSVVIRRTAYETVGGYKLDLPYTCDWELYMRVAAAYDWWHEPSILAHYRQYSNSLTMLDSFNGVSGTAHRHAIEIAQTYMPPQWAEEISQTSRVFHFEWCVNRAMVAMQHGAWLGAMKLAQEALLIDPSEEAEKMFLSWINQGEMEPLRAEFSHQLFGKRLGKTHLAQESWTSKMLERIRHIEW